MLGNFIGTDAAAGPPRLARERARGASQSSFQQHDRRHCVGARNVICGHTSVGIEISANNNTVQGNFIGTSLTGATAIPNSDDVFVINSSGNVIDGTAASAGNVNSGNTSDGVQLAYGTAVAQPNSEHLISTTYPLIAPPMC